MPKLTVDGIEVEVPAGATVLQAGDAAPWRLKRVQDDEFVREAAE